MKVEQWKSDFEVPEQSLLWVHQEVWQQDLLLRYGNTITMIDATYKTTNLCTYKCYTGQSIGFQSKCRFVPHNSPPFLVFDENSGIVTSCGFFE